MLSCSRVISRKSTTIKKHIEEMSTRKTTAAAAAAKVENATAAKLATTTTTAASSVVDKTEMGANTSTTAATVAENQSISNEKETVSIINKDTATTAITAKPEAKQSQNSGSDPKRITRNSPLLLVSPNSSTTKKSADVAGADSEPTNSESEDGCTKKPPQIRGRKSLKDLKEAVKEAKEEAKDATKEDSVVKSDKEEPKESNIKVVQEELKESTIKKEKEETTKKSKEGDKQNINDSDVNKESKECKDTKEPKESKEPTKETKEKLKEKDQAKLEKEGSPASSTTSSTSGNTSTNRQTRKSVAQELASKTRMTRNRHTSGSRPETPPIMLAAPTRRRPGAAATKKIPTPMLEPASKRKRSNEEASIAEPGAKYIKIEVKDDDALSTTQSTEYEMNMDTANSEATSLKVKQELIESDESSAMSVDNAPVTVTVAAAVAPTAGRGRGRWGPRKPVTTTVNIASQAAAQQTSPSTRATRQTKIASPSTTTTASEPKRRRTGGNTIKRSSSQSLLKSAVTRAHDEDSKDSLGSSTDDMLLADIKMEKLTPELTDDADFEMDDKSFSTINSTATSVTEQKTSETEAPPNGLPEPLTVDTATESVSIVNADLVTPEASTSTKAHSSSEKAASLSPEMVSEGVSEISVKQFYKKPQFLENNLGIEEDPKLGEIVQKVSTEKETTTTKEQTDAKVTTNADDELADKPHDDSYSSESIKEGELRFEESNDDEQKKSPTLHDNASRSSDIISPLIVEDDDDEADDVDMPTAEEEEALLETETETEDLETEKLVIDEEDIEDDITVEEESETISMDNNASLHDDAPEEREEEEAEMANIEELEQDVLLLVVEETTNDADAATDNKPQLNEKTKNIVCDKQVKAKLKIDTKEKVAEEHKVICEVAIKSAKDEKIKAQPINKNDDEKPEKQMLKTVDKEFINKAPVADTDTTSATAEKSITIQLESVDDDDDDVLAKIDAELKKIGEKLKERPASAAEQQQQVVNVVVVEENKENVALTVDDIKVVLVETPLMDVDVTPPILAELKKEEHKLTVVAKSEASLSSSELDHQLMEVDEKKPTDEKITNSADDQSPKATPISSTNTSPCKVQHYKEDDTTSVKSGQSTDTNSWITLDFEHDEETLRQKEQHLQNLGLLTHKAAEKRRLEYIQSSAAAEVTRATQQQTNKRNGKSATAASASSHEYTGTLKTVIKLNRNSSSGAAGSSNNNGRKNHGVTSNKDGARRQSLKMTFQKGRARGQGNADRSATDQHAHGEDAYYTIQNENEGAPKPATGTDLSSVHTHGRKSYNRSNNTSHSTTTTTTNSATIDSSHSEGLDQIHGGQANNKKDEKEEILIPEKASSFKFHPGRLCEDQCFYCSGKFGLYDTPCHVGQIKSMERQQKVLANEEKLTVDNCLCDACFRHVDRRANVPSYKKRLSAPGHLEHATTSSSSSASGSHGGLVDSHAASVDDGASGKCLVPDCANPAAHSLRRKCIRKSVKKFLLNFEMPAGSQCVWLCQTHYDTVIQSSGCVLCKRRLGKNHMYHITSDTDRLEKALSEMGIPVQLGIGTAVCKLCRYFANLLMKPPDSTKSQKAEFVKNYRKRLLQFHNIHDGSNDGSDEVDEDDTGAARDMQKTTDKTSQKDKIQSSDGSSPLKELHSPTGSTSSSVECLGEAAAAAVAAEQHEQQQQMLIDSDALVDYDVPMISTDSNSSSSPTPPSDSGAKQMSKLKAILQSANAAAAAGSSKATTQADISNVLRANPNISMRELFPGEEDLGLQFKAPFGSAATSQRTPEGWTRVQTFLQYDEPTRRLWEELQKPYGNQSSFLRHLILLEKYYRNGDLVLSPNASSNASVYTQTVRQRLTSYDQGHCGGLQSAKPSGKQAPKPNIPTVEINEDEDDEIEEQRQQAANVANNAESILSKQLRSRSVSVEKLTKQLSTNAVTITTRPKETSSSRQLEQSPKKSLLKDKDATTATTTNVSGNSAANLAAANAAAAAALASASSSNSRSILKSNLLGLNKAVEILPISASASTSAQQTAPVKSLGSTVIAPETTKQQKILDVANKLLGNQLEAAAVAAANSQNTKGALLTSPPELVSLQRRASGGNVTGTTANSGASTSATSTPVTGNSSSTTTTTTHTPSAITTSLINAKRPQLLPKATLNRGAAAVAAATAPPNVVILPDTLTPQERLQSKSWRPTLMPVEENQHLLNKGGPLYQTADGRRLPALVQVQSGGKPFLISIFDYNRMCILRREKLLRDQMLKASKNRHELKQQQQMQKNAAAVAAANLQQMQQQHNYNTKNAVAAAAAGASSKQQQHQAAQQQLIQLQLMQLQKHQQLQQQNYPHAFKGVSARYQSIAPKPTQGNAAAGNSGNVTATATSAANNFPMPLLANAITSAANTASTNAAAASTLNNASWLWNNFPDANQLLLNGAPQAPPKLPQLLHKSLGSGGGSNSAASTSNTTMNATGSSSTITSKQHQHHQQQLHQQQQHHQQLLLDNALMSKIPKSLTVIPQHKLMNTNFATAGNNSAAAGSGHKE